jgi:sugar phosphate isomerase/epimerase
VLIDTLHLARTGGTAADLAGLDPALFPYVQLCDGPAQRPTDMEGLIRQSGEARLDPGAGAFDLAGILDALPAGLPISLEVPDVRRAAAIDPLAHAIKIREATEALLERR